MKVKLIIVPLICILSGCGEKIVHIDELVENRNGQMVMKDSGKLYSGRAYELHKNGKKKSEGTIRKGIPDGPWTQWDETGQKESEGYLKKGTPHGLWIEWQGDGLIWLEKEYKDGELINQWNWEGLSESEIVESLHHFKAPDGTMYAHRGRSEPKPYSGEYSEMHDFDNQGRRRHQLGEWEKKPKPPTGNVAGTQTKAEKKLQCHYKNGKLNGQWTGWYKNGIKHREAIYDQGTLIEEKFWNLKGEAVQEKLTPEGVALFYPPEEAVRLTKLAPVTVEIRPSFKQINLLQLNNKNHSGYVYDLHESGSKALEGNLKHGMRVGKWAKWHRNGQQSVEANFEDGVYVTGTLKRWSSEGDSLPIKQQSDLYANSFFSSHYSMD